MRIVAVADTHLYHDDYTVPDGDMLVHAGDLCRFGTLDELRRALDWLHALPHRHKVLVAGNHDRAFQESPARARALLGAIRYLQDEGTSIEGLKLWGSPWQPEYHGWAFNLPRGEPLAAVWREIPAHLDILVTHGPPAGIGDRSPAAGRAGCEALRIRVEEVRPRLHLFGHIHQDGGVWYINETLFANVTSWECEHPPTVIDIDKRGVTVISAPRLQSP